MASDIRPMTDEEVANWPGWRNCQNCAHANDEGERALTFGPVVVCTNVAGFFNGKLMQATARCESWAAPDA